MKRLIILSVVIISCFFSLAATANYQGEVVGIGFEFGNNYIIPIQEMQNDTVSRVFNLKFRLSKEMAVGYYKEDSELYNLNALQLKHKFNEYVDGGIRFGSATYNYSDNVYTGVFGTITPFEEYNSGFAGAININVGYDFIPESDNDYFKIGVSSLIIF